MSSKSISPIPVENALGGAPISGSSPAPDLSALRKGWSAKSKNLPSFPEPMVATAEKSTKPRKNLPELPSLGAMASKAALAMEGYEDLFGENPSSLDSPISILEIPIATAPLADDPNQGLDTLSSEPSIFDLGTSKSAKPKSTLNIPLIPEMALPESLVDHSAGRKQKTLSAMPTMAPPKVSIPLVRDQFTQVDDSKESAPEPRAVDKVEAVETTPQQPAARDTPPAANTPPISSDRPKQPKPTESVQAPEPATPDTPEYTDQDLREALRPIIEPSVDKFLYTPTQGIHTYLEPMLRSTVRRAIAEQMEDASPFREVSGWDKFAWKMRAAFSSRTYEDIVFDHTKRYQVEEVFLLRPRTRSLISYASHDPARHAKPKKVNGTVKKIAAKTAEKDQQNESSIKWENDRQLMIRKGDHCILAAIVHGSSNAILRSDLDYALRQAEERFGKTLEEESDIHLQILQPLLEGCLLIQAPAIPN